MSLAKKLQSILDRVHGGFTYAHDSDKYAMPEWWAPVTGDAELIGDCEEFARKCCVLARADGLRSRLVFCGVHDRRGDHLVCEVDGYILDNRSSFVKRRDVVDYHWVSISGYAPGDAWLKISS